MVTSSPDLQLGLLYWIPDTDHGWIRARLHRITDQQLHLQVLDLTTTSTNTTSSNTITLDLDQRSTLIPAGSDTGDLALISDLTQLDRISIASLLATLRARFQADRVYTYAGLTLVSVNPFKPLPDQYGERQMTSFLMGGSDPNHHPPHIYAVAQRCRQNLIDTQQPQSLIICGDSGAGKTEAAKYALQYLVRVSAHATDSDQIRAATNRIQTRIVQCNPVLEAFGNAETVRNENSSRFGKYLEINVEAKSGVIRSASMTYFMLEMSRITAHGVGERCFHAFYAILVGLEPDLLRDRYGLQQAKTAYRILVPVNSGSGSPSSAANSPGRRRRPSIPSLRVGSAAEEWTGIVSSMTQIGMSDDEINAISSVLAAILHLGNIRFESDDQNQSRVIEDESFDWFLRLQSLDRTRCLQAFTCRHLGQAPQHVVQVPVDVPSAESGRNALAKEMYGRLFRWIVARINLSLQDLSPVSTESLTTIGILDVFGFERFDDGNGFEQLCINYCNERLQAMFIESVLSVTEQAAYLAEGIEWSAITLPDCTPTLNLIETVMKLLDDECLIPQGSVPNLFTKIVQTSSTVLSDDSRRRPLHFTITHYAGQVQYGASEFMVKNRDRISDDMNGLLETSSSTLILSMMSSTTPFSVSTEMQADDPLPSRRTSAKRGRFQAGQFRGQVQHLMTVLGRTTPHFIRCIKPNHAQRTGLFQNATVLGQLGNAGVLELVRVRQTGFPIRLAHDAFLSRYRFSGEETLETFLQTHLQSGLFAVGKTLIFLKDDGYAILEQYRDRIMTGSVIILQAVLRTVRARSKFQLYRRAVITLQAMIAAQIGVRAQARRMTVVSAMATLIARRHAREHLQRLRSQPPASHHSDLDLNQIDGIDAMHVTDRVVIVTFGSIEPTVVMQRLVGTLRDQVPFRIYNLCLEVEYDAGALLRPGELAHFPFSGHTPCPFKLLCEFCESMSEWVSQPDRLGIIQTKGGRGKCSLMLGAFLLHQGLALDPNQAMANMLTLCSDQDPDRYLAPSQRRYLHYYYRHLQNKTPPVPLTNVVNLTQAVLDNLDPVYMKSDMEIWLMIATQQEDGKMRQKWIRSVSRTTTSCTWKLRKPCRLSGDIKIEVLSREKRGKVAKVLMYVCIHAAFVQSRSVFTKLELDKVYRDVDHEKFSPLIDLILLFGTADD